MKACVRLLEDLKRRYAYFEKPSDKRRREASRRIKNIKKAQNPDANVV
jgi:ribosomal protein S21